MCQRLADVEADTAAHLEEVCDAGGVYQFVLHDRDGTQVDTNTMMPCIIRTLCLKIVTVCHSPALSSA